MGQINLPKSANFTFQMHRVPPRDATFGPPTRLKIRVKPSETEHTVCVSKLQSWLDGCAKCVRGLVSREERGRLTLVPRVTGYSARLIFVNRGRD